MLILQMSKKVKISIPKITFPAFWDQSIPSSFSEKSSLSLFSSDISNEDLIMLMDANKEIIHQVETVKFSASSADYDVNVTPLMFLIMIASDKYSVIDYLVKNTNKDSANSEGTTPMMVAIAKNDMKMVTLLLENGFTFDQRDNAHNHVLAYVRPREYTSMFNLILNTYKFESNGFKDRFVQMLLFNVISHGETADYIIESITDITDKTHYSFGYKFQNRKNLLMYACEEFCSTNLIDDPVKVVTYLIMKKKCDFTITAFGTNNNLIAHIAEYPPSKNQLQLISHLALFRLPLDEVNISGKTPLISAVLKNNVELVQYLIKCPGVDINREFAGESLMFMAAKSKFIEIVKVMYYRGCRTKNKKGASIESYLTKEDFNIVIGEVTLPEYNIDICSDVSCPNRLKLYDNCYTDGRENRIVIYMGSNGKQYCNQCLDTYEPGVSILNCMIE